MQKPQISLTSELAASMPDVLRPDCSTLAPSLLFEKPRGADPRRGYGMHAVERWSQIPWWTSSPAKVRSLHLPFSLSLSAGGASSPTTWPDFLRFAAGATGSDGAVLPPTERKLAPASFLLLQAPNRLCLSRPQIASAFSTLLQ
jgi:hypothetical protein